MNDEYFRKVLGFLILIKKEAMLSANNIVNFDCTPERHSFGYEEWHLLVNNLVSKEIIKYQPSRNMDFIITAFGKNGPMDYATAKVNVDKLSEYIENLEKTFSSEKPITDWYSPASGEGFIKEKGFKLFSGKLTHKLFSALANEKCLERSVVSKILNSNDTDQINLVVKRIRKTTGLDNKEIVLSGGNIVLKRKITIKS